MAHVHCVDRALQPWVTNRDAYSRMRLLPLLLVQL